ncbi:hypothetical protein J6E39_03815 [bacterium]|nr:hypothetical protein [bacterium]
MKIIKIENYPNVCDTIQFNVKDDKLDYIDFFLNGELVHREIKNALSGLTIKDLEKKIYFVSMNPEVTLVLKMMLSELKDYQQKTMLKHKIMEYYKPI